MSSEKNYECKICDKVFKIYSSYYSHKRNLHLKPRLKCANCHESFSTHNLLYKHSYKNDCKIEIHEKKVDIIQPVVDDFLPFRNKNSNSNTSSLLCSFAFDN